MYMLIVEFVVSKGKVMTVGKVRYLLMVAIITLAPLILIVAKAYSSFLYSMGSSHFVWRRSDKASSTRRGRGRCQIRAAEERHKEWQDLT
eukprot:4390334-Prorocentrum_lima.AAC.1